MAKETLVGANLLLEALKGVLAAYAEGGRTFSLVMLIPTEPASLQTSYTLVVSAPWLDEMSPREAITTILKSLIEELGSTQSPGYRKLARITPIRTSDQFVETVTTLFPVPDGNAVTIQNQEINGVLVERAILLRSQSPDQVAST